MILPLACVNEPISVPGSRPGPTYTLKVRWRLPAVRISCVLAAPDRRLGSPRAAALSVGTSPDATIAWWGSSSSSTVARTLSTVWSSVLDTQRAWSATSYQTLQRVGTSLLRSASWDKLLNAAGGSSSSASASSDPDHQDLQQAQQQAQQQQQQQQHAQQAQQQLHHSGGSAGALPQGLAQYQASLARFVTAARRAEVDEACMLAHLSDLSYDVAAINQNDLQVKHRLKMVKCSHASSSSGSSSSAAPAAPAAATAAAALLPPPPAALDCAAVPMGSPRSPRVSLLSVLPAAPEAAADDEAPCSGGSGSDEPVVRVVAVSSALAAVAAASVSRMAAAEDAGLDAPPPASPEEPASPEAAPPADWFACDGEDGAVRYVVFQGSLTLEHWKINLTFDPVAFEGFEAAGIKVHRGVYLAAQQLYDSMVPLVAEHLARRPGDGRVAFAGHSLGGSLATVLMLLLVHRGVLPADRVAGVHTFGAPAVFCEGASSDAPTGGPCGACALPCRHKAAAAAAAAQQRCCPAAAGARGSLQGLLQRLGLRQDAVRNVIMTRDIVPRAFVCDYTAVADVLKRMVPSFKEHVGLAPCKPHKVLYNFLGSVEVLHPPLSCGFVLPDEGHFMLPTEAALYKLQDPQGQQQQQQQQEGGSGGGGGAGGREDPLQLTLGDAILAFMNSPHPLETLGAWRAYGTDGSISRFHNPANYMLALDRLRELTPAA